MLQIANPVYDVVFKYLMDDNKAARLLLSAILGAEIISLEARPTELNLPYKDVGFVLRLDYSARILDEHGEEKLVIIEMQKAKMAKDIMRFRQYLGEQYANPNNVVHDPEEKISSPRALPILSIYFLGHTLQRIKVPVLKVNRAYIDAATGDQILEREEFVESLTHDSFIIQIPYLEGHRRTPLEQLLAVFDQSNLSTVDHHFLLIEDRELPEDYRPVLRRLQTAMAEDSIRKAMLAEDRLLDDIKDYEREIAGQAMVIEDLTDSVRQKDNTIQNIKDDLKQKDSTIQNITNDLRLKDNTIQNITNDLKQKDSTIQNITKDLRLKDNTIQEMVNNLTQSQQKIQTAMVQLFQTGVTAKELADIFQISHDKVLEILNRNS